MSFEQIVDIINLQNPLLIYAILMASAFLENVFPPFPGDMTTLAGAFLAYDGNISYIGVLLSVTSGGIVGVMFLYYVGREKGRAFFEKRDSRFFGRQNLVKVDALFLKYGAVLILFSRFLAGIRSAIAIAAGVAIVRPVKVLVLGTLGNLLWSAILIGLMYYTHSNWQMILNIVKKYHVILVIVLVVALTVWALVRLWKKRRN